MTCETEDYDCEKELEASDGEAENFEEAHGCFVDGIVGC